MKQRVCPLKFNNQTIDKDGSIKENACLCEEERCGWWNDFYGMCGIAAIKYLESIEVTRQERKDYLKKKTENESI